jgi:O-antigen biosynthesis protein
MYREELLRLSKRLRMPLREREQSSALTASSEPILQGCISPSSFWLPELVIPHSAWLEHTPFAFWLIGALRPRSLVELGVYDGFSYFAFCQAVLGLQLETRCYAVDTWKGDEQTGFYGEEVFQTVCDENERRYSAFSTLIRSTFDEASHHFTNKSIDLLHIDGRHLFDDVKHDFETWQTKLSNQAVVLFHDTNVRERDFGVFRFWEQLRRTNPHFEFLHGHGLGVLGIGKALPDRVLTLFAAQANAEARTAIQRVYSRLGSGVALRARVETIRAKIAALDQTLSVRPNETSALYAKVAALDQALQQALSERDSKAAAEISALRQPLSYREPFAERLQAELSEALSEREALLSERDAILYSTTWLATRPLRRMGQVLPPFARRALRQLLRSGYKLMTLRFVRRTARLHSEATASPAKESPEGLPGPGQLTPEPVQKPSPANQKEPAQTDYDRWVREYDTLTDADRNAIRAHVQRLRYKPVISVIMPAYDTPQKLLSDAIASVRAQLYPYWELCVADDASPSDAVIEVVKAAAAVDPRIKWTRRETNGHIAATTNTALELASGDFVALLDHDDLLAERALYEVAVKLNECPDADLIWSDEDRIDSAGNRHTPYFKTDWDFDLMLGQNAVCHLSVYRHKLIKQIGGLRVGFEGAQDYDLTLRAVAASDPARIHHIPAILYHWREADIASSFSKTQFDRCADVARQAVTEYLSTQGYGSSAVTVMPSPASSFWNRVRWFLPEPVPKVSLIVPTRDRAELLARCVAGLLHRTDYPNMELLVVDNGSTDPDTLGLFDRLRCDTRVRVLAAPGPFNFSALNNKAAREAAGEVLVLVNNDVDVIRGDWLREMVSHAMRPEVGAVGAKLLYANHTVQHGGVLLGMGTFEGGPGVAGHVGSGKPNDSTGYFGGLTLVREFSAVTAACMALRREVFEAVGGFDEVNLPVAFNDVDLCLRIRERGFKIVWTPFAELYHLESISRGADDAPAHAERVTRECRYMRSRWGEILDSDPFYNVNLSRDRPFPTIAFPPRRPKPWLVRAESVAVRDAGAPIGC